MQYAIVDIETTGGYASQSRITEIAIIIHDGHQLIETWETLVNPQKEIPLAIFALTGITNEMVANAPTFDSISDKVYDLLKNRIFVAHNVNFDYSFVKNELELAGHKWSAPKLCTVRAARKIIPGHSSYSLGRLCKALNITLENAHRAGSDAKATVQLFELLILNDNKDVIKGMLKKTSADQRLPANLPPEDFENLPNQAGVYYFHNQRHKVIYVGKAVNIKKRVTSHFTGHKTSPQRQHFLKEIYSISYEVCGTELMALLLEVSEIKKLWPIHNKALKKYEPKFGLFNYEARNGYQYLAVGKLSKNQPCIETFNTIYESILFLNELSKQFKIEQRFCKYGTPLENGNYYQITNPELPNLEEHNAKVTAAIENHLKNRPSFAIIDKGRNPTEKSCIWVENGHFYGMGYFPYGTPIHHSSELKDYIVRYSSNNYIMQVISSFALKNPSKIIRFPIDKKLV